MKARQLILFTIFILLTVSSTVTFASLAPMTIVLPGGVEVEVSGGPYGVPLAILAILVGLILLREAKE